MAKNSGADDIADILMVAALAAGGYWVYVNYGAQIGAIFRGGNTDMGGTDFGTDTATGGSSSWGADSPLAITVN